MFFDIFVQLVEDCLGFSQTDKLKCFLNVESGVGSNSGQVDLKRGIV